MTADVLPFPEPPIVTLRPMTLGSAAAPRPHWHIPSLEGRTGWGVVVCCRGHDEQIGFYRHPEAAWQQVQTLASLQGWRAAGSVTPLPRRRRTNSQGRPV
jgi:hypothetical protein